MSDLNLPASHPFNAGDLARVQRTLCMIANTPATAKVLSRIDHRFDLMYAQLAFVPGTWERGWRRVSSLEAREGISALEKVYKEVCAETALGEAEEWMVV